MTQCDCGRSQPVAPVAQYWAGCSGSISTPLAQSMNLKESRGDELTPKKVTWSAQLPPISYMAAADGILWVARGNRISKIPLAQLKEGGDEFHFDKVREFEFELPDRRSVLRLDSQRSLLPVGDTLYVTTDVDVCAIDSHTGKLKGSYATNHQVVDQFTWGGYWFYIFETDGRLSVACPDLTLHQDLATDINSPIQVAVVDENLILVTQSRVYTLSVDGHFQTIPAAWQPNSANSFIAIPSNAGCIIVGVGAESSSIWIKMIVQNPQTNSFEIQQVDIEVYDAAWHERKLYPSAGFSLDSSGILIMRDNLGVCYVYRFHQTESSQAKLQRIAFADSRNPHTILLQRASRPTVLVFSEETAHLTNVSAYPYLRIDLKPEHVAHQSSKLLKGFNRVLVLCDGQLICASKAIDDQKHLIYCLEVPQSV